jgi:hypothetical protein
MDVEVKVVKLRTDVHIGCAVIIVVRGFSSLLNSP